MEDENVLEKMGLRPLKENEELCQNCGILILDNGKCPKCDRNIQCKDKEHEYFVSLVFKTKVKNRNEIINTIQEMVEDQEDIKGFEYIAWRVDGVEE